MGRKKKKFFIFLLQSRGKKCEYPPPFVNFIIIFAVFLGSGTDIATSPCEMRQGTNIVLSKKEHSKNIKVRRVFLSQ